MSYIPGQPVTAVVQRVEIHKLRQGENLILGFSIGGGIDQDPSQNPFSEDKTDKGIYVTRVSEGGPAEIAGLQIGDKIMQPEGTHRSHSGTHAGIAPKESWLAAACCGYGAWHPQFGNISMGTFLGDPDPLKPCFQIQRAGTEVGCVLSLGQVNGWDMTMVTHDQARKRLTKRSEEVVRLLVTRQSLQKAVQQSMLS
ncbi:Tax1-binding protein 3 [Tupaia chinensis]|uniref:Tax1-binding protein 3 n=1 Tax=Tupaia chinensis TaxID=246437 RepID=L8Y4J7_TUPCH|nr:Tax1-binding protein 3 [Tupaia chinensis]